MANPTSNFGWQMPTSTDLVTDLPADFEVFGQAVDTDFVDLLGGTTGQILSKTSNTDLDFTWITPNPGDITEVTAGTGLTGGGTSGAVTLSFDQANFGGGQYAAGKNKIINGSFAFSQRGNTFTNPSSGAYTLDRFSVVYDGTVTSHTVSQQTFTPGTAPVTGYEGSSFARWAITTNGTSTYRLFTHRVEDVRTFAGQQITFSFWMKADSARTLTNATYGQNFGSGGSGTVESTFTLSTTSLTTSWQRITGTATVPSISGKTIGTGSNFFLYLSLPTAGTFDMWGWQVEAGSIASPFQTATGTIQGELAACQRYYYKTYESTVYPGATANFAGARVINFSTVATTRFGVTYPSMRSAPTITVYNPETGSTASLRTDIGTNLTLNGPFAIGREGGFVDTLPASTGYGSFHLVAVSEL